MTPLIHLACLHNAKIRSGRSRTIARTKQTMLIKQRLVCSILVIFCWTSILLCSTPLRAQMMGGGHHGMFGLGGQDGFPPATDPASLPEPDSSGAKLLRRYCDQCHGLPGPGLHTAEEWPAVVARMKRNMDQSGMMMRLMHHVRKPNKKETETLVAYLQANGRKTVDAASLPDPDSPGAHAFQRTCSQCHALPDPKQHTAAEWPATVTRMTQNMRSMNVPVPDSATLERIVGYLTQNAK